MKLISFFLLLFLFTVSSSLFSQELIEQLKPFQPLVGKTWKAEFENGSHDVSKWESILNGKAVRIIHSVNNGEYGGESITYYDSTIDSLVSYYFTTAGFYTKGKIWFEGDKFNSHENVIGEIDGITEVRATGEITPDGKIKSTSQYLKNGEWTEKQTVTYEEAPDAEVIFKK